MFRRLNPNISSNIVNNVISREYKSFYGNKFFIERYRNHKESKKYFKIVPFKTLLNENKAMMDILYMQNSMKYELLNVKTNAVCYMVYNENKNDVNINQ